MKSTTQRLVLAALLLSFTASFSACTAKRQAIFSQGQGTNLDQISVWKERMVPISTGTKIGVSSTTHAQDAVKVSPKVKSMNYFDLVKINVEDKNLAALMGTPPFRGKDGTQGVYELKVKLTDNYLKFYKVAQPEFIPYDEQSYKEETLADGRIAIPMLGYKVSYFRVEAIKTNDDQDSHHLGEIPESVPSRATHVRVDWTSREFFQAVKTMDLIPSSLFFTHDTEKGTFKPYEWYYAETIMEKSLSDSETRVGETSVRVENSELIPASKIMFIPRENELRVVNVARDERMSRDQIQNSGDLNSEAALIIPVAWTTVRTKSEGVNLGLSGEKVEDRKWSQRSSLELNIPELKSAAIASGTTRLLDLEVDENYFSFTVLNMVGNNGRKIHYSFLRADQGRLPYRPKASFKSDQNLFGFFTSEKPFIPNWEYYTEQDYNKRIYVSRMNPDAKEIVFHLSLGSPEGDIAARAVEAWNQSFQKALKDSGKQINVVLAPERVPLGDLRYNVIHLVDTLNEDGLLGFGPSVADPETGEIVSATTNVYVNSTRAIAVNTIRQYIIDRLEKRLDKNAKEATTIVSDEIDAAVSRVSKTARAVHLDKISENFNGKKLNSSEIEKIALGSFGKFDAQSANKDLKEMAKSGCHYAEQVMMGSNDHEIQKYCKAEIETLVDQYSGMDFSTRGVAEANWEKVWADSKKPLEEKEGAESRILTCARKLTRGKLLSTLIHEIGHNFGLRHNFSGSYDKANFKKVKSFFGEEIIARTSSIMEYTDWDEDRLTETGNYDVAAIRFGYGDQVELKDGSIVAVDTEKALTSTNLKPYLFCTDEVAYTDMNALCKTNDAGTNPKELVQFYIKNYERKVALRKLRRVKMSTANSNTIAASVLSQTLFPLKDIYDQWRYYLGEYVRKSNRYLSDYDSKSYITVLKGMAKDPQYGPIFSEYYEASEMIYKFFKELAFSNNNYCLVNSSGDLRAIELERLRDLINEATRGSSMIRSCADILDPNQVKPSVLAEVLGASSLQVNEIGYPLNSYRYEQAESLFDNLRDDVIGNEKVRLYAGLLINYRSDNLRNYLNQFAPNMIDEPHHYLDFAQTLMGRLIQGVDLSKYGFEARQPLFVQEGTLMSSIASVFQTGMYTPGDKLNSINQVVTRQKLAPFTVYSPAQGDDPKQMAAVLTINDRMLFAAIKKNHVFAYNLINRYQEIDGQLSMEEVSPEIQAKIMELVLQVVPTAAELPKKTVEDFVAYAQLMGKIEESFADFAACFEGNVPAMAQVNEVFPEVVKDFQAAKEAGDDALKAFMATNLVEYMKTKLGGKEFLLTQENMKVLEAALNGCSSVQAEAIKKVSRNRKDYEAQKSMILDVLNAYAR